VDIFEGCSTNKPYFVPCTKNEQLQMKLQNEHETFNLMNDYSEMVGWKFRNETAIVSSLKDVSEKDGWL
jgi:hypothetical protein